MHILILPSEEFVPPNNLLAGIFQLHQANILKNAGYTIGVISIKQSLSIPMIFKAMLNKLIGRRVTNELENTSIQGLSKILCRKLFSPSSFVSLKKEEFPVLRIEGFYYLSANEKYRYFGWQKAGMIALKSYIKEFGKPDIIHAHNAVFAGILAEKIKQKMGIPYIITEHSSAFVRRIIPNYLFSFIRKAFDKANGFYVVSPFLGNGIINLLGRRQIQWEYIPNVIDPFFENAKSPVKKTNNDTFIFLIVANLYPWKGHKDLIKAFSKVYGGAQSVSLIIGGEGYLKDEIEQLIEDEGCSKNIFLLGKLSRAETLRQIDLAHCLVLSSHFETFGVVLIEALSRGKPVIATKCGGPELIVNDKNGFLCDIKDVDSIADALVRIREFYNSFDNNYIRADAINRFGHLAFLSKMEAVYGEVLKAN